MPHPQNKPHADKPGSYDLIFRRPRTEVAPGEWAEIDIYITGYGCVSGVKLYFMPPTSFIESGTCSVEHSIGVKDGGLVHWGSLREEAADEGMTLDLSSGGLTQPGWHGPSLFFDMAGRIATELSTPEPPIRVKFKVRVKVGTGDHTVNFALTYFNGREWCVANRAAIIHVPTLYERYEGRAWAFGAAIAVITLVTSIVALFVALAASQSSGNTSNSHATRPAVSHTADASPSRTAGSSPLDVGDGQRW